jgi:hypothetical protein
MVVYNLICQKNHQFEGWFPNYEEFQKQAEKKLISCPSCGSTRVEKLPHACAVHVKKDEPPPAPRQKPEAPAAPPSPAEFNEMLIKVHHYIRQNFEDVGPRFAEEARQFHKGEAEERPQKKPKNWPKRACRSLGFRNRSSTASPSPAACPVLVLRRRAFTTELTLWRQ